MGGLYDGRVFLFSFGFGSVLITRLSCFQLDITCLEMPFFFFLSVCSSRFHKGLGKCEGQYSRLSPSDSDFSGTVFYFPGHFILLSALSYAPSMLTIEQALRQVYFQYSSIQQVFIPFLSPN